MTEPYSTRHDRVRRSRGSASSQSCIGCGGSAQEWAQLKETTGEFPEDYQPMCCSCHQKYDDHWDEQARAKVSESVKKSWASNPARRQFSEEHRENMRLAWVRRKARTQEGGDALCL